MAWLGIASVEAMEPIDAFIDRLPKVELHLHLVGSASVPTVLELARRHPGGSGVPRSAAELAAFYAFRDFPHFADVYAAVSGLVREPADVADLVLGAARDGEVLAGHLRGSLRQLPVELRIGPVDARIQGHFASVRAAARTELLATLDSERYFSLLDDLDRLLAEPPLTPEAARPAAGSCITVVITDGPLDSAACTRLARRAGLGLARTGSTANHGSGEIFLALATGLRAPRGSHPPPRSPPGSCARPRPAGTRSAARAAQGARQPGRPAATGRDTPAGRGG